MVKHSSFETETREFEAAQKGRRYSVVQLVKSKVKNLQKKIESRRGQVIAAVSRGYEPSHRCSLRPHYDGKECLNVGIITKKTRFPEIKKEFTSGFLLEVDKCYRLGLGSEEHWEKSEDGIFRRDLLLGYSPIDLFFMDRPPALPDDSSNVTGDSHDANIINVCEAPRLEFLVGNTAAIPFLQKHLRGWQYVLLGQQLEQDFPISSELRSRIMREQLDIYDKIAMGRTDNDGADAAVQEAVKRKYHKTAGMELRIKQNLAGVCTVVNMKRLIKDQAVRRGVMKPKKKKWGSFE